MSNKVIQLDMIRGVAHHTKTVTRIRMTISYDPELVDVDVKQMLERLRKVKGTPYFGRSLADIGGMILADELESINSTQKRKEAS